MSRCSFVLFYSCSVSFSTSSDTDHKASQSSSQHQRRVETNSKTTCRFVVRASADCVRNRLSRLYNARNAKQEPVERTQTRHQWLVEFNAVDNLVSRIISLMFLSTRDRRLRLQPRQRVRAVTQRRKILILKK